MEELIPYWEIFFVLKSKWKKGRLRLNEKSDNI